MITNENYIVVQTTHAPYSTSAPIDALEAAMAATNVGLHVVFVFLDAGVLQLMANQDPLSIKHKNIAKKLSALPLFDLENIYAHQLSLEHYQLDISTHSLPISEVNCKELEDLCQHAKQILVF